MSSAENSYDLNLDKIDDEDVDQLANRIESFYKADTAQKAALSYHWEKNHLFLDGKQWLSFEGNRAQGGVWNEFTPFPQNDYIPRPCTNYIFDAYQTLKGYMLKNKPRITVRPNTQTAKDKIAATIAELVSETNYKRLREAYNYEYAASCLLVYGTVFKKSYWDSSYGSQIKVPKMVPQPVTDPNTGMPTGEQTLVPAHDPLTGEPLFETLPLGDLNTKVVEPYCVALDPLAVNLHEARWIMEYSIRPLSWIVEMYQKEEPGYTGKAVEVKEEKNLPNAMRRFFQLRTSSGIKEFNQQTTGMGTSGTSEMITDAAIVKEHYSRPSQAHPQGRLVIVANGITLYRGPAFDEGDEQGDWHPYSECRWEPVPGRFWGKGPFDDATEIQKHINSIDSLTILARKTTAIPQKLEIDGQVMNGAWTGRPGQRVKYRPGPNGEKPEVIPAMGLDPQVFQERAQKVQDLKNITGAMDILKGDRPPGVTAASAIALLFEVATGKLAPILDRWKELIESDQKKQLKIVARKYREPRPEFIQALVSNNSELTPDIIRNFVGDDLHDNCNVIIEASSSIPKLRAAEQALLLEVQQTGALNLQDPANQQEFLSRLGITGFNSSYNKDESRAELENMHIDNLMWAPENKPVVLMFDDDAIHIKVHSDRTKEPSFMDLPAQIQQAFFAHIMEHENAQGQKQQQQMMQQAMMGQVGAGGPAAQPIQGGAATAAGLKDRKGPGVGSKIKQLLGSDMLGPSAGMGTKA